MQSSYSTDQTYSDPLYKGGEKPSFIIVQPFALDVKGGEKLGEKSWYLQVCFQVHIVGDQTPKWLPSSPKGGIGGIMVNVLSLMATYLIKMSTL